MSMITSFEGKYSWLSNFDTTPILWGNRIWSSAEHAFQASKTLDYQEWKAIFEAKSPGEAKGLGRKATLREDWEDIKISVMRDILLAKFQEVELKHKLLQTGDQVLIEGNWWGDTFWGVCKGQGLNMLGKLLMEVRLLLQINTLFQVKGL